MEDINFWKEDLAPLKIYAINEALLQDLHSRATEIQESALDDDSREVSTLIAGYISKKLEKRSKCSICKSKFFAGENGVSNDKYLNSLSRGGLVTPSPNIADFVDSCFAILDYVYEYIQNKQILNREICSVILKRYAPSVDFTCNDHVDWGFKFASQ